MTMDALAAVSLAGSAIQFIDFVGEIISKTHQLRNSGCGFNDQEAIAKDLKDLSIKIQSSTTSVDPILVNLCSRCHDVANELLNAFAGMKVKGSRSTFWMYQERFEGRMGQREIVGIPD